MTDRELLELAAKAAGIVLGWDAIGAYRVLPGISGSDVRWRPLEDDGDALRLVVRLKQLGRWEKLFTGEALSGWGDDPYAATRHAIVRVAARAGKAMP